MDNPEFRPEIRVKAKVSTGLNLLSIVNDPLPCLVSLAVENLSERGIKDLRLSIRFDPSFGQEHEIFFQYLGPKSTSLVSPNELRRLSFNRLFFSRLTEATKGRVLISIRGEGSAEPLLEESFEIDLYPYDTFLGRREGRESQLASYVMPNLSGVKDLCAKVSERLREKDKGFACGYQEEERGVLDQIEETFLLLRSKQFQVQEEDLSRIDRISIPDVLLVRKEGTVLDLALLYASILENIGLHALLAIKDEKAYVGCFLEEDVFLSNSIEYSPSHVQSLIEQKNLILIDVSKLSNPISEFKEATESIEEAFFQGFDFFCAIDISICRDNGIFPLPLHYDEASQSVVYSDQRNVLRTYGHYDSLTTQEETRSGFDVWERELLDLSMNNPLLNYRIKKSLSFLCDDAVSFARSYRSDDRFGITARPATMTGTVDVLQAIDDPRYASLAAGSVQGRKLVSFLTENDLRDRLKYIYRKYRDNLNEKGANTLYLTIGLLRYYEVQNQDNLGAYRVAPLVLVPVDLVKDGKSKGSYSLRLRDDEWMHNTTLIEFLKKERGFDLSGIESILPGPDGHLDVERILAQMERTIKGLSGWSCHRNYLGLGSFDFTHYCMWNDLRLRKEAMGKNPIIRSLASGRKEWSEATSSHPVRESDCCIPLVADSSQIEAIMKCADGKSFILFGPPGTGKSQTIVNMIANSLYHGKKVLFVSEKQAALDVVYNRLKRIGLDPFCLQLHSAKASKAMVLRQFSNAFKNAQLGSPSEFERYKESIATKRTKLEYDIEVFHRASPCFLSINDALIGYESVKESRQLPPFSDDFLRKLTPEDFQSINDLAERIAYLEAYGHFGTYFQNDLMPLRGHAYGLEKRERLSEQLDQWIKKAQMLSARVNKIKEVFRPNFSFSRSNVALLARFLTKALVAEAPVPLASSIVDFTIAEEAENISSFLTLLTEYQSIRQEKLLPYLKPEVLKDKSLREGYSEVKSIDLSGKIFHRQKSASKAKKILRPYEKNKIKASQATALLTLVIHLQDLASQIDAFLPSVRNVFREQFVDIDESDAVALKKEFEYSLSLYQSVDALEDLPKKKRLLSAFLSVLHSLSSLNVNAVNVFLSLYQEFEDSLEEQRQKFDFDLSVLPDRSDYYASLPGNLQKIKDKLSFAPEWANMNSALDELKALGLESACTALKEGKVSCRTLKDAIDCRIYLGIALLSIRENNLESFSGLSEEATIRKFNEECALFRELSIAMLRSRLSEDIPNERTNASPTSELGFLKKAISSNGHGKGIRMILDGAINLVRTLCPCFLMSPMSAATYLSPNMALFDVVIFDEASQIPTAEAVGPISRGRSLIVCGDSNQLPPTSFFKRDNSSSEDSDFLNSSLPSILEECKAIMLPEQELRWHYRSRSESLIAFSNHEFYNDSLYTFPSIDDQVSMVRYVPVQSAYDRSHSRTNAREAEAIVKEVLRRKKDPRLKKDSIGIVCFSQAQKDLVEDKLDDAMTEELKQEDEQSLEPIFVKNLENVQGDERDVIIFSIGYGMDRNKKMSMNFGPINGINGFRRLNVAISRARKEMLIYTNIDPDLYHDEDIDNPGAQYLFRFLRYAKHGRSELQNSPRTQERKKEVLAESLAAELRKKGYGVHTSVGDSAFHLHLALADKEHPEDYLLGVMIEGEKGTDYHLVDKLQIQPEVLKSLGWKTIRVYAIDWINSPNSVITEIEIAYRKALEEKRGRDFAGAMPEPKPTVRPPVLEKNAKRTGKGKDYVLPLYHSLEQSQLKEDEIQHQIAIVLKNEAPLSERLLQKRIASIFGITRLQGAAKELYDKTVEKWKEGHLVTKNKDGTSFFWYEGQDPKKLGSYRRRGGRSDRNLDDIPKEEIAVAIYDILMDQFAIDREGLARQLLAYFGLSRDTGKFAPIIEESIDYAIENRTDFLAVGENGTFLLKD